MTQTMRHFHLLRTGHYDIHDAKLNMTSWQQSYAQFAWVTYHLLCSQNKTSRFSLIWEHTIFYATRTRPERLTKERSKWKRRYYCQSYGNVIDNSEQVDANQALTLDTWKLSLLHILVHTKLVRKFYHKPIISFFYDKRRYKSCQQLHSCA